jgi:hypothetical protein
MFRLFRRDREKGASAVEFALVLPLFLTLVFGIVEAGWLFAQLNDVRHGVREGARLAAVDYDTTAGIGQEVCDRMDLVPGSSVSVVLSSVSTSPQDNAGNFGATGSIAISFPYQSLTSFLDPIFGGTILSSDIEFRLEQPSEDADADWWPGGTYDCS